MFWEELGIDISSIDGIHEVFHDGSNTWQVGHHSFLLGLLWGEEADSWLFADEFQKKNPHQFGVAGLLSSLFEKPFGASQSDVISMVNFVFVIPGQKFFNFDGKFSFIDDLLDELMPIF